MPALPKNLAAEAAFASLLLATFSCATPFPRAAGSASAPPPRVITGEQEFAAINAALGSVARFGIGIAQICAIRMDGAVVCGGGGSTAGAQGRSLLGEPRQLRMIALPRAAEEIAVSDDGACARLARGPGPSEVWCWGWVEDPATTEGQLMPAARVDLEAEALQIASGGSRTCALLADATVACWAWIASERMQRMPIGRTSSVRIRGLPAVDEVAVGALQACARTRDGAMLCWGSDFARVGCDPGYHVPEVQPFGVDGLAASTQIVEGFAHGCALSREHTVQCWGESGVLGAPGGTERPQAILVQGLDRVAKLAAAGWLTCALRDDASVRCWGQNLTPSGRIIENEALRGVVDLAVGLDACGRLADGTVRCSSRAPLAQ